MNDEHKCNDCGEPPRHPGSVVRLLGKNAAGDVIELCSKCFGKRQREAAVPAEPQLKKKGKKR